MRFSNPTRKTVRVYGYLYDTHPLVSLQIRTNSNWRDVELGYCGTGVGNLLFEPGSFVECQVPIPKTNGVYRYGITYRTGAQTNAIWSQAINWTNAVSSATPHAK